MKVAIVAGPDAGHAFPAFALAERFAAQGISAVVYTGLQWYDVAAARGVEVAELPGLQATVDDDDEDAGAKLSVRAARMAVHLAPVLATRGVDLVISDVITVAGLWAAELAGIPAIELSPHPLYLPSRGLPPIGTGMAPGVGVRGRLRDGLLRAASNVSVRTGDRQRARARTSIGLSALPPAPLRMVATLPELEVPRPDWPESAHMIGPLLWEPTTEVFTPPPGDGPLIMVAPSTAVIGAADMVSVVLDALRTVDAEPVVRVVISSLTPPSDDVLDGYGRPVVAGLGRQDLLLAQADLVICGGGHGMLSKALLAGVPVITVPGGGDQWELANRVARQGSGVLVRPLTVAAVADAVHRVLGEPSYARAAARVAASIADVTDPVRIARRHVRADPRYSRDGEQGDM
ncbi:nucleotide disphospho-sugar-binding domain-containing protein [Gordonia sp. NB41Y]|uniref:glycosyltransferase n=1 Tax=Gordonia sp. NB41Y TaxID=875808 RepID=UPI0006B227C3|nr:nucleotide disphospho-sugar-binding domain-containing protein [Gordonia sp. NB41Y]KOY49881.1 glycosyl transferase [Gordonia sp. NB41Y]WLP92956.1 glycosyltransferase [Gordonia sp. NB41Y]